uniref:Uncharacterized protein n=1 Tax=Magallana gigas TaxID=29159 RepID=A0A8W8N5S2_MAGGI
METALCIFMLFLAGVSANITGQHVTTGECVCVAGTNVNARTSASLSASVGAVLNTVDIDPGSRKHELISKCSSMGGWPNDEINHIHCQFNH